MEKEMLKMSGYVLMLRSDVTKRRDRVLSPELLSEIKNARLII